LKGRQAACRQVRRIEIESTSRQHTAPIRAQPRALAAEGGESIVTFTDLVAYLRARFGVEEGQTMAEYGVVLAVITGLVVIAIGALSGAIAAALDTVRGYL
jgi:Flp pilus assembly pilin Flp